MSDFNCGVVVLAAGMSLRMGAPKLLLPWQGSTVIREIINSLEQVELAERVIVLGSHREEILIEMTGSSFKPVFNPQYQDGNMLNSIQCGIRALQPTTTAAMIALGDQPSLSRTTIKQVINVAQITQKNIVIPSYKMRRGHPWLIKRRLFNELLAIQTPSTLRDLISAHESDIEYVITEDRFILQDMDTPEDYQRLLDEKGL